MFPTLDLKRDMNPDLAGLFSWAGGGGSGLGAASKVPVFEGSTFWCQQSRCRKTHIVSRIPERKLFRDVESERAPPPGRKRREAQKTGEQEKVRSACHQRRGETSMHTIFTPISMNTNGGHSSVAPPPLYATLNHQRETPQR